MYPDILKDLQLSAIASVPIFNDYLFPHRLHRAFKLRRPLHILNFVNVWWRANARSRREKGDSMKSTPVKSSEAFQCASLLEILWMQQDIFGIRLSLRSSN